MSIFDVIIITFILILGVKGFFNGFIREIAGFIGIVGGLYLASIYYHKAGIFINDNLFIIKNSSAIDLVGFVIVFFSFWMLCIFIGFLLSKMFKVSSFGFFDKLLGLVFSAGKFFIIISIILALFFKIDFIKRRVKNFYENSKLMPIMLKTGEKFININIKSLEKNYKDVKISNINLKGE